MTFLWVVSWVPGLVAGASTHEVPLRTVYNARTHRHEQLPEWEFEHLLEQGSIEATADEPTEHSERTYRRI
jgi:hypothetical protein